VRFDVLNTPKDQLKHISGFVDPHLLCQLLNQNASGAETKAILDQIRSKMLSANK